MYDTKEYQNYNLKIIVNKRLKHSYITIDRDKNVLIKTPYKSELFVQNLLNEKKNWIQKQLQKTENFKFLSETEKFTLEYMKERVEYFSGVMNLEYSCLKFRKMKSRWGSCSSRKIITLNKELLKVDKELIDYVIVHELAHLKHMNHSKAFHSLVDSYLPSSKEYRKQLKSIRIT